LEVAKRLKRCISGATFVEVLQAAEILSVLKYFLKSRFIVIGKFAITLHIYLVLTAKIFFLPSLGYSKPALKRCFWSNRCFIN